MTLKTDAIGKEWPGSTYQVGREAARAAGFRDVVAPPMFCVVYALPAMAPGVLDP